MRRLIRVFAGLTYHIVGNLMHWLIWISIEKLGPHPPPPPPPPPLEIVGPPLDSWKSIVFFCNHVIKPSMFYKQCTRCNLSKVFLKTLHIVQFCTD